jgi:hypothetical protein
MMKVVMGSIGKYIDGGGAETIFVEKKVFGQNVVNSVLGGTHYVRSLKGMFLLSECIQRLQWSEFFSIKGVQMYGQELQHLKTLKDSVSQKQREQSKQHLDAFMHSSSRIMEDFKLFTTEQSHQSETFAFWDIFVQMVALLKDLIRADREGNWELHLHSLQRLLPLFAACDRTNYLRWCSLYLEDMRRLPETAPAVHQSFLAGKFVVKRTPGLFNAIGADMCLEQTINRSQKSTSGIIGNTKKKQYVAQWEMIYHEMLALSNLHREISGVLTQTSESVVSHEFNKAETDASERKIDEIVTYIKSHDNPTHLSPGPQQKLHNILTQEIMSEDIRKDLLGLEDKSINLYNYFRTERFVCKEKKFLDTIHRTNLKTFKSIKSEKKQHVKKSDHQRELANALKILDIACVRKYDIKHLFQFD